MSAVDGSGYFLFIVVISFARMIVRNDDSSPVSMAKFPFLDDYRNRLAEATLAEVQPVRPARCDDQPVQQRDIVLLQRLDRYAVCRVALVLNVLDVK